MVITLQSINFYWKIEFFEGLFQFSEDGEIKYIKFDDYVSFMLGAKAANNELLKAFCNNAKMEQN